MESPEDGFALQMCTVRYLGLFLEDPLDVPWSVIESRVAAWPRKGPVSQTLLTGPVFMAVCWLMIRWGLAVPGQRSRR